jgi:hypothetical protein
LCLAPVVTHFRADHQPALGFPVQARCYLVIASLAGRIAKSVLIAELLSS